MMPVPNKERKEISLKVFGQSVDAFFQKDITASALATAMILTATMTMLLSIARYGF